MAYTVRGLEDLALWIIVMMKFRARLAGVEIDSNPPVAQFRFWKTDGSQQMVECRLPLDLPRRALEQHLANHIAGAFSA